MLVWIVCERGGGVGFGVVMMWETKYKCKFVQIGESWSKLKCGDGERINVKTKLQT